MANVSLIGTVLAVIAFASSQAASTGNQVSPDKLKEAAMIIVNDCKDKEGATDDDIKALKEHKLPQTDKGLCMLQCLFNSAKIIKDGKFSKEGAIDFCMPAMKGDEVKTKKMREMMEVCEKEIGDATGCEVAKLVAECTHKHGKEFGFVFPNALKH